MSGALDQFAYQQPAPKKNLPDILTASAIKTEGLLPGQLPLRMPADKSKAFKNTVQGVPLDWSAHSKAPADRKNFYFVAPGQEAKVIKKQWQNYFATPGKYGLTNDSTIGDVIRKFDQSNPKHKLKFLQDNNIDINMKIKDARNTYDMSFLSQIMDQQNA